jgi:hypothetical protein
LTWGPRRSSAVLRDEPTPSVASMVTARRTAASGSAAGRHRPQHRRGASAVGSRTASVSRRAAGASGPRRSALWTRRPRSAGLSPGPASRSGTSPQACDWPQRLPGRTESITPLVRRRELRGPSERPPADQFPEHSIRRMTYLVAHSHRPRIRRSPAVPAASRCHADVVAGQKSCRGDRRRRVVTLFGLAVSTSHGGARGAGCRRGRHVPRAGSPGDCLVRLTAVRTGGP